jgi:hypothetical protein
MKRRWIGLVAMGLAFAVGGCGGESSGESASESTGGGASPRCEPLPAAAAAHLGSALYTGDLVGPVAVRSDDFEHVYFVAARVGGEPALWAMNRLDGSSLIISINDHAYEVSGMGRGADLADPISEYDDGAAEALSCV